MESFLTVGQIAERSGVAISAIHFCEAKGLIGSVRSSGNQRRFHRSELRRIAVIKVAQRAGISLAEIGEACRGCRAIARSRQKIGRASRSVGRASLNRAYGVWKRCAISSAIASAAAVFPSAAAPCATRWTNLPKKDPDPTCSTLISMMGIDGY